jgi:hypothetical protein
MEKRAWHPQASIFRSLFVVLPQWYHPLEINMLEKNNHKAGPFAEGTSR